MKSLFSFFMFILFVSSGFCQVVGINDGMDYGFTLLPTIEKDFSHIEGSPFLDEGFQKGAIQIQDKEPLLAKMRYNVVDERIEIKLERAEKDDIFVLPKRESTIYRIGKDEFRIKKIRTPDSEIFGYFIPLFSGENTILLKKYTATVSEPKAAKTAYEDDKPARIIIDAKYYAKLDNKNYQEIDLSSRRLKKQFSSRQAKDYLNNNKVRTEQDLMDFMRFLQNEMQ